MAEHELAPIEKSIDPSRSPMYHSQCICGWSYEDWDENKVIDIARNHIAANQRKKRLGLTEMLKKLQDEEKDRKLQEILEKEYVNERRGMVGPTQEEAPYEHTMGPVVSTDPDSPGGLTYSVRCSCDWWYVAQRPQAVLDMAENHLAVNMSTEGKPMPKPTPTPTNRTVSLSWEMICHILLRRHAFVDAAMEAVKDMGVNGAVREALENVIELQHEDDVAELMEKLTEQDATERNDNSKVKKGTLAKGGPVKGGVKFSLPETMVYEWKTAQDRGWNDPYSDAIKGIHEYVEKFRQT